MVFCVHKAYLVLTRVARSIKYNCYLLSLSSALCCVMLVLIEHDGNHAGWGKKDNTILMCLLLIHVL